MCAQEDETCDYGCLLTEYFYWALTTHLGGQDGPLAPPGRCADIADEWQPCQQRVLGLVSPVTVALFETPGFALATRLPLGDYDPGRRHRKP